METIKINNTEILNPYYYGSESDPCFGKLFSLEAPECQLCGDRVLCQAQFNQRQLLLKTQDLEPEILDWVSLKLKRKTSEKLIVKLGTKKFDVSKEIILKHINYEKDTK